MDASVGCGAAKEVGRMWLLVSLGEMSLPDVPDLGDLTLGSDSRDVVLAGLPEECVLVTLLLSQSKKSQGLLKKGSVHVGSQFKCAVCHRKS